ncbi:helix-turn-helix domain-containing protein [Brevundimonas sp.]
MRERPIALTINEACEYASLSRSTIYNLAKAGKLPIRKVAGRSLILRQDLLTLFGVGGEA